MTWRLLGRIGAGLTLLSLVAFAWIPNPWAAISTTTLLLAATTLCFSLAGR